MSSNYAYQVSTQPFITATPPTPTGMFFIDYRYRLTWHPQKQYASTIGYRIILPFVLRLTEQMLFRRTQKAPVNR
jgi:hypothetical protein